MKVHDPRALARVLQLIGAAVITVIVTSVALSSNRLLVNSPELDYASLAVGIAAGLALVLHATRDTKYREVIAIGYVVVMGIFLFFYTFLYVGMVHDAWL